MVVKKSLRTIGQICLEKVYYFSFSLFFWCLYVLTSVSMKMWCGMHYISEEV